MMYALIALSLVVFAAYEIATWIDAHALAVHTPSGSWEIAAYGMAGLWEVAAAGIIIGLIAGLLIGGRAAHLLAAWMDTRQASDRQQLADERLKFESDKAALQSNMRKAAALGRKEGEEAARRAQEARYTEMQRAEAQRKRADALEGRLKGAQQKAARQQKALLKRGDAPKPA